jgi:hypothetical protein
VGIITAVRLTTTVLSLAASLAGLSCATLRKDQTVCPEFRELRCMTEVDCTYDQGRGCRVCACSDAKVAVPPPETAFPPR